ncbi:hypothetical protein AB833_14060 [Chromatiales bacterium (ex Bugula neritina AB1)]|nr:hypothetical protein AB833_14060 [Chromatiales bacterium (ex Bugula neritina AB1)]
MESGIIWKLLAAGMMLFFVIRLWPAAKAWMADGPKGSSSDWMTAAALLGGVMLFVWVLLKLV